MKIINLFGGPGTGKSTIAAGVFQNMKMMRHEVELVTEYAKDLVWEERSNLFNSQDYISAKQCRRLSRLEEKVDWVVTDSPLLLGLFYISDDFPGKDHFCNYLIERFNSYDNINIFLKRTVPYNPNGRIHNFNEAKNIDSFINDFLLSNNVDFLKLPANNQTHNQIIELLELKSKKI